MRRIRGLGRRTWDTDVGSIRVRKSPRFLLLVLSLAGTLASCAAIGKLNLLSTADEVAIGRQAAKEVEKQVQLYRDAAAEAYVLTVDGLCLLERQGDAKMLFEG